MQEFLERTLPFWNKLTADEREYVTKYIKKREFKKNEILYQAGSDAPGLKIIYSGQIRLFITTPNGAEVTLSRLGGGRYCALSIFCMEKKIDINLTMQAEMDSVCYLIPADIYNKLSENNSSVREFTQQILTERLLDVIDIMSGLVSQPISKRLADNLLQRMELQDSLKIKVTHDEIACDIGSAREVVSRVLKNLQNDGLVKLSRGTIEILDKENLRKI